MKITIVCVGKIKERFYRDAVAEFEKRLSRYCKLEIIEVADEKTPDGAGVQEERQILEREACRMEKFLKEDAYLVALAVNGREYDSEAFAGRLEKLGIMGESHITFLIGGSLGIAGRLLDLADEQISFSRMTFPHQLMRVILLEQIYRGYRIMHHEPYHK